MMLLMLLLIKGKPNIKSPTFIMMLLMLLLIRGISSMNGSIYVMMLFILLLIQAKLNMMVPRVGYHRIFVGIRPSDPSAFPQPGILSDVVG